MIRPPVPPPELPPVDELLALARRGVAALERIAGQLERDEVRAAAHKLAETTDTDPKRRVLRILRAVGEN